MMNLIALFDVALLLGGMVFFAAVMAPLVFTRLPAQQAGIFIREVFPVYYLYVFVGSAVAAVALSPRWDAVWMAAVGLVTLWLRQWLMPRINTASDAARKGDTDAKRWFDQFHRFSVVVNFIQILVVGLILARFAA